MKKITIFLLTIVLMLTFATAAFAEYEPNDSRSNANQLYMGSNSGKLSSVLDRDWWTFTTAPDAPRKVKITYPSGTRYVISLYYINSDGQLTYQEQSIPTFGDVVYLYGGWHAFTYYLEVKTYAGQPVLTSDYKLTVSYL